MELRICGSELELAEFLKALGTSKVIAETLVSDIKPKKTIDKPKKLVDTKYLASKYNVTAQAIRNYTKVGMPYKKENNSYKYDEAKACVWIDEYMKTHPNNNRGIKYASRSASTNKIKKEINQSEYTKWRKNISQVCKNTGVNEGKILSLAYKRMTKNYGIVWEQLAKDFYNKNKRKAVSTLELAYALEQDNKACTNLLECCIDSVSKEIA